MTLISPACAPKKRLLHICFAIAALTLFQGQTEGQTDGAIKQADRANVATGREFMVATVDPLATQAAVDAFERGGNAIDAAVAAALMLGVVDGFNSGIGGGCFVLIRKADGELIAIDARETAPAAASRDMFVIDGKPQPGLSRTGPLAVGVPGALAGYAEAVSGFGELSLRELIEPAAEVAERGFVIDESYYSRMKSEEKSLSAFPGSRAIFFRKDGSLLLPKDVLKQPDLAKTYRMTAEHGPEYFYQGEFAETLAKWMTQNGGIITREDLAGYRTIRRKPLVTNFRDWTVVGFPPPSSGGVHVAQMLNILEAIDIGAEKYRDPALRTHLIAEAMKLAFADRAWWLGDPAFAQVPAGLVDQEYARQLASRIDPQKAATIDRHAIPPQADTRFFDKHTTHIAAADRAGNWVAITTTVNTSFGSCVIVPGTGVVLNNQMDDFSIAPGVPNAFGLVGNEANSVQPGKRPLSSMSPTIVLLDGQPVLTVGAAGGPRIITQVLLTALRHLEFGEDLADALGNPRLHHQWSPDKLYLENGFDPSVAKELERLGHSLEWTDLAGTAQAIAFDHETGRFTGVHDPRVNGQAAGK
jgi:gamma-glutamyltranspeptidase / glutathione hydrolase